MSRKRGRGADPEKTRADLVAAAFESLRTEGFRGTTARSIAGLAGCNQAAIYYHFGGIEPLLIEALGESSTRRLEVYRSELAALRDLAPTIAAIRRLYEADRESGHLAVMAELVGGITSSPDLAEGIEASITPWLEFVESKIADVAAGYPFGPSLPVGDLADLIFSLVIGLEMRSKIDGSTDRADRVFTLAAAMAAMVPKGAAT